MKMPRIGSEVATPLSASTHIAPRAPAKFVARKEAQPYVPGMLLILTLVAPGAAAPPPREPIGAWDAVATSTLTTTCGMEAGGWDRYRITLSRAADGERLDARFELLTPEPTGSARTAAGVVTPIPHVPSPPAMQGRLIGDEYLLFGWEAAAGRAGTTAVARLTIDSSGRLVGDLLLSYVSDLSYAIRPDLPNGLACAASYAVKAHKVATAE